jgi:hypothetical protein
MNDMRKLMEAAKIYEEIDPNADERQMSLPLDQRTVEERIQDAYEEGWLQGYLSPLEDVEHRAILSDWRHSRTRKELEQGRDF